MGGLRKGRHVTLRTAADGLEIAVKVLRVADDVVVLDPPTLIGGRHRLEPGVAIEICWKEQRRESVVRAVVERSAATLAVRLIRERRSVQRRAYVRSPTLLGLEVTTQTGATVHGVAMDVSAVGLRAHVPVPFAVGDHLRVVVRLPDGEPIEAVARVARRHAATVAGLAFVDPPKAVTERLVRFVLAMEQRAAARRSDPPAPTQPGSFRRIEGGGAGGA